MIKRLLKIPYLISFCLLLGQFAFAQIEVRAPKPPPPPSPSPTNCKEAFKIVDEMPHFPIREGLISRRNTYAIAERRLQAYIKANISYPEAAKAHNIEGEGIIQIIVSPKGYISPFGVIQSPGYGLDKEMIRIIHKMNADGIRWVPGKQHGKPVRVLMEVPIVFEL
jgi:outer membrane biosynthesis protein TonB